MDSSRAGAGAEPRWSREEARTAAYFWPIWVIGGWGVGLAAQAWRIYGQSPISEADIADEMQRLDDPPEPTPPEPTSVESLRAPGGRGSGIQR